MSRCFPFPPPGYENKTRTDDVDLLKKEKRREKKHKKEKKDKEKKDKSRSESKEKEREKKEKRKDRNKNKEDKDKEKDKSSTLDEKKSSRVYEGRNGEVFRQNQDDTKKNKNGFSNEKAFSGKFADNIRENLKLSEETKNSKFVQELGRRISEGDRESANQSTGTYQKKDEPMVRLVAKDIGKLPKVVEKYKDKKSEDIRMDWKRDEAECSGNNMVNTLPGSIHLENAIERKKDVKDNKTKKEGDDKHKDKNREKKSHRKEDKKREKEKKNEEKMKKKIEQKSVELNNKLKEFPKNDLLISHSNKMSDISKDIDMAAAIEGNFRKRKELEPNGICHDTDARPNKLPRPPSSHPLVENGKILEPIQIPMKIITSNQQGVVMEKEKPKINGIIETKLVSTSSSMKPGSATVESVKITKKPSTKPPHPDSRYLGKIYSVPKMEEWPEFDDQEWLLGSNETRLKKPKVEESCMDGTFQVWEKAVQVDSTDFIALPYVVPY